MTTNRFTSDHPRIQAGIAEMKALIQDRYPSASFDVGMGDDPVGVYLTATVDVADPDEVVDLIIDRLLDLQIDEGLPLYVIPVRTPERIAALLAAHSQSQRLAPMAIH